MEYKINNTIIGLLKNMLRKNETFHKEGFIEHDDVFFKVVLDISGFPVEIIMDNLTELSQNDRAWHKTKGGEHLSGDIECPSVNLDTEVAEFYMRKPVLINIRNSVFSRPYI